MEESSKRDLLRLRLGFFTLSRRRGSGSGGRRRYRARERIKRGEDETAQQTPHQALGPKVCAWRICDDTGKACKDPKTEACGEDGEKAFHIAVGVEGVETRR